MIGYLFLDNVYNVCIVYDLEMITRKHSCLSPHHFVVCWGRAARPSNWGLVSFLYHNHGVVNIDF